MKTREVAEGDFTKLAAAVRKVHFLSHLSIGEIQTMCRAIELVEYTPGEKVVKEGKKGDAFFIVYKGKVDVIVGKSLFNKGIAVATLGPGGFFGETALVKRTPRTATVICRTKVLAFKLGRKRFQALCIQNQNFRRAITIIAEERIDDSLDKTQ